MARETDKTEALNTFGKIVFGDENRIGIDIEDIKALRIQRKFERDVVGVLIQFSISYRALDEISSDKVDKALDVLLGLKANL